jgi:hypothetical protein
VNFNLLGKDILSNPIYDIEILNEEKQQDEEKIEDNSSELFDMYA